MVIMLLVIRCYMGMKQGGPGFEAATLPMEVSSGWMKLAFDKGYQIL